MPRDPRQTLCAQLSGAILATLATLAPGTARASEPPPFDATADTVFDIITTSDPTSFVCLDYVGRDIRQMWDKRIDGESDLETYLFRAHFSDGAPIDIILNPEFGSVEEARQEAERYTVPLGQLPPVFRAGFRQLGIHKGDEGFHGGAGKVFLYAGKVDQRIAENHLEESLLHESVHASLDRTHAQSEAWLAAQASDGRFVTEYAAEHPDGEDLAETALFAYGLLRHPGRIPPVDSAEIAQAVPARIAVIRTILDTPPQAAKIPAPPDTCR